MSDQRYISVEKTLLFVVSLLITLLSGFSWGKIISDYYTQEETFIEQNATEGTEVERIGNNIMILSGSIGIGTAFIFRSR